MTIGVPTVQQDNLHRASGTVEGWEIGESSDGPWDRGDVGSGCSGLAHPGKRMCSADVPAAGWGGETGIGPSVDAIDRRAPETDPARAEGLKDAASAPGRAQLHDLGRRRDLRSSI